MTDRLILRLSPGWAILADRNQWILAKWIKPRPPKSIQEGYWHARSYVGSTKTILARCMKEKGATATPEAMRVIDSWPERFLDWRRNQDPLPLAA